ncbi:hypothetical protein J6590_046965 [Homalodisca vitripennis]|nr:hypothetical protein J6590_046965 [Homalodisca vitripennis]
MVDLLQTVLVQNLGSSLVREYLFRTGLKCTLKCMDDELPRSPESFNNRILLARELNIEHLLQEYKQINCPAKSVLEIMLCVFLKKREVFVPEIAKKHMPYNSLDNWSKICQAVSRSSRTSVQRSQMVNIDRMQWFYRQLSDRGVKIDFQTLVLIYCDCFGNELHSYSDEDTTEGQDCQFSRKSTDGVDRRGVVWRGCEWGYLQSPAPAPRQHPLSHRTRQESIKERAHTRAPHSCCPLCFISSSAVATLSVMHPFHRKHTNGGTIQGHRTHNQGKLGVEPPPSEISYGIMNGRKTGSGTAS